MVMVRCTIGPHRRSMRREAAVIFRARAVSFDVSDSPIERTALASAREITSRGSGVRGASGSTLKDPFATSAAVPVPVHVYDQIPASSAVMFLV